MLTERTVFVYGSAGKLSSRICAAQVPRVRGDIAFVACVVPKRVKVPRLQADFDEVFGTTQGKTAIAESRSE